MIPIRLMHARLDVASFAACASLVLASCASSSEGDVGPTSTPTAVTIDPSVAAEFERHRIVPNGAESEFADTLPSDLMATANWGTKIGPCRAGGYDVTAAAGHPVRLLRYPIPDRIRGEPLYAWVVIDGESIACVFRSVREHSEMAPGVFPASGD